MDLQDTKTLHIRLGRPLDGHKHLLCKPEDLRVVLSKRVGFVGSCFFVCVCLVLASVKASVVISMKISPKGPQGGTL